ncbi:MAG: hypothetical protein Q8L14_29660 [Myxococcales bacterium]|nr:hypothetical protein [Myxococcales bacterium]
MKLTTILGVLLLAGCGATQVPCGPSSCQGCCDAQGSCVATPSAQQCGSGGNQCSACGAGAICLVGSCSMPQGTGGGVAGGGSAGGSTAGGDAGGSAAGGSAGGSTAGGSAGGSTAGGSAGGSTAGGSAGGSTAGGSAGGSTAGGSAGGSTAGGSAGGSTAGGSAGGSTAGGSAGGSTADAGLPACGGTLSLCGTTCLDTLSDENNCGGCGVQCSSGRVCNSGTCMPLPTDCVVAGGCAPGFSCNPVTRMCAPGCRINSECPTGATCNTSSSTCSCPTGQHLCGQACVPNAAVTSCGGSCAVCPAQPNASPVCLNASSCDFACNAGFLRCGNACTTCNPPPNAVGTCANGTTCDFTCNQGFLKCGTTCAACTTPANASPVCSGTSCDFTCNFGFHRCGNQCVSNSDVNSCGSRCTPCPAAAGSTATCVSVGTTDAFTCACAPGSALCGSTCVAPALATCSSHGTCSEAGGSQSCSCHTGYAGATCNTCAPGYQDNDQNGFCVETCATFTPNGCNGRGTCSDASGTPSCTCTTTGYSGVRCETPSFVQVASGGTHACGLRSNGTVECWGSNNVGQTNVPAGLVATRIAAGVWYSCALPTTGGVKCWGDAVGVGMPMDTVVTKPNTGAFVDLFGGTSWACAQTAAGALTCFGANYAFVNRANTLSVGIGDQFEYAALSGTTGAITSSGITGTAPTFANGYATVDCGQGYCCAVRESRTMSGERLQGAVQCWGSNTPNAFDQSVGRVSGAPALTVPTVLLSAGDYAACAIRSTPLATSTDLTLVCWGSTNSGIISGSPFGRFVDVSVSARFACAVAASGEIRCWGQGGNASPSVRY